MAEMHKYSDRPSFDRILLLVATIAQNPGIAPSGADITPMVALLEGMKAIAIQQGIPWQEWQPGTIRKDLSVLRDYGILPSGTSLRGGYYLGGIRDGWHKTPAPPRASKAKIPPSEMAALQSEGRSLSEIAAMAGISKQGVDSAIKRLGRSRSMRDR